ncbi:hypothetical protein A2154_02240 [Candidatus Gottesmanbacteria bacterium RBG_16_43_7]|uniref:hydroxymethylglutaryl-CoA reductase (NADPH) n=1 Tax=Candidatus Gottesmanbacteria bacterium RBG_16_43_7 TaxID=1798373 RepID=A0A1F5ZAV3_9BACT|nr:MAG: hypothetical protein A2154_02240 [Candidatus Gottesmanbacteria bacterium RBG_16_43_7]
MDFMNLRNFSTVKARRAALEKDLKVELPNIGSFSVDEKIASSRNCENMIGSAKVPLGIAGPIKIKNSPPAGLVGKLKIKNYYVPLATTEGALVASVNRGCKAIYESGGAHVDSYKVGPTRGAVFQVNNLKDSDSLNSFLERQLPRLKQITASASRHLTLKKVFSRGVGRYRFVRFIFDSGEAMGMNMVTIATTLLCQNIEKETGARCITVAANYDTDKKPSWLNIIEGRGYKVWSEAEIPGVKVTKILKTTPEKIYEVWLAKCMIGSAMAGSMGYNAHFANILAAIFIATGQDPAHVAECTTGITTVEVMSRRKSTANNDSRSLYVSIYLPDLMVGTIGGGTGLATQKEALQILGLSQAAPDSARKLAEIIAAAALAGELSLLASLAEGSLARAHQSLARSKA